MKRHLRGRDLYRFSKGPLLALALAFHVLPRPVASAVWSLLDFLPGKIGLGVRYALAKRLASGLGDSVFFGRGIFIKGWSQLRIGNNVSIHRGCYIDASGGINIGSEVSIAHNTSLVSFNHTWNNPDQPIRLNPLSFATITLDDDVWVGCGVRILAGAELGTRSIVAAGAVVAGKFAGNVVIGGVPAKKIRDL